MKKFLRTGKKALSVFMAVMMVLTAWVFFEPMEAEAATAGTYDYAVRIQTTNSVDVGDNKDLTITLDYKKDNGTGSAASTSQNVSYTWAENDNADNTAYFTGVAGFPTKLNVYCLYAWTAAVSRKWGCTITVSVKNNNTGNYVQIAQQSFSTSGGSWGQSDMNYAITSFSGTPSVTAVKFISGVASINIPKTGESDFSTSYTAGVYDQYGVRMTYDPTIYVKSTAPTSAQTASDSITGVTMSSGTLKVTSAAQLKNADTKNIYIHAKYNALYANKTVALNDQNYTFTFKNTHGGTVSPTANSTSAKKYYNTYGSTPSGTRTGFTFKGYYRDSDVADSLGTDNTSGKTKLTSGTYYDGDYTWYAAWQANQYTATFSYKDSSYNNTSTTKTQYYTTALTAPSVTSPINVGVDYTYTFTGWSPSVPSTMPASSNTYTAQYSQTIHYANLSALNTAITNAKAIYDAGNPENAYHETQYTAESWSTFTQVYDNAVTMKNQNSGNGPLLSAQKSVNEMADLLNSTRPIKSKLTVVFVDEDGAIIKDGFHLVDYGTTVTAPANPTKDPDATYHYTFNSWASTDSDSMSDLNPVTHNLKFVAKFTKTAHTFTTTTASGCHGDTVTTKTCSTCGYSETTASDVTKHTWSSTYKTIVAATCAAVGKEAKYCTQCGAYDATSVRDIAKKAHTLTWVTLQNATCGATGVKIEKCSTCGYLSQTATIAKTTSHSYQTKHTCAATCTADGYTVKVCSVCGLTDITTATKLGHNLTTTTTQAATCASVGVKETKCSRCDYGKTEIIPATGTHSYGEWTTISTANCISKGVKTRECSVCGKVETEITNETAHSWGAWTEVTPATCTGKGVEKRTCPTCGQSETKETTALGHNFVQSAVVPATCEAGGYTLNVCDRSGCGAQKITNETAAKGHSWTTVAHDADCTHSAYTEYKCANDASHNYNKYDETKPALGHDFTGTEAVTKAATCTEDGTKTIPCTRCSEVQTVTIPKTGHNYTAEAAVPPSCTTSGYTPYTCSACDDTYNVYDSSKPATGHNWGDWNVTKAPTETTDGEQTRTCSVCGATETAPVPATSHTLVEDTSKYVAPTCTADGQKVYKCTATHPGQTGACTYTVTEVVPKLGHNLSTTKTDATCTVDGKVTTSCSRCDYKAETVIPATGHSYTNAVTTEPTCTTAGVRTYTCQHDRTHTYTEAIEKLPHDFVEGDPVAATCTESAYTPYKCKNCTEAYVKITAHATGHNYAEVAGSSTATCTAAGTKTLKCADCDSTITVAVPALGHDYQKTADTVATCAAAATETYKCSRCDASYTISVGDKTTAHDWNEWTVVENATYDSLGYKTRDCKVCGKLEVETIPCLGDHVFDNETGRQDATCTADGYIDYACSAHTDCGATSRVVLPATGHNEKLTYTAASCEVAGKSEMICDTCKVVLETKEIPATGHAWGAGEVTKQPTCTAKGEMKYTCSVCSATKTEEIATNPNAHVYTAGAVTPATCVTPELTTYSCACGKSEIKQTKPAAGHSWNAEKTVDKNATCIDAGSKSTHCANCYATKDAEVIPATGHSLKTQKVDPTCTTGGYTAKVCEVCGYLDSVTAVDPLGHDYEVTNTTAATCTEGATETKTCKRDGCAETVTTITSNPTGHNWGEWSISKPATATEKGEKTRKCNNDPTHTETCEIPTIGHKWDSGTVKKAATCYKVGTMLYTCTGCENCVKAGTMATLEVEIPKTEHTYTQETTPATCEADGTTVVKCSVAECGYEAQTVTLPATGHTLERDTASDKAPTCTDTGVFAYKCKNCDYKAETVIPATGHSYTNTVTTQPTCTTAGVRTYTCSKCSDTYTETVEKLPHDFAAGTPVAATCTESGYTPYKCNNCDEAYVKITAPATGHNYAEVDGSSTATCTAAGTKTLKCADCDSTITVAVPALGHDYQKTASTTATCAAAATETYKCSRCDASYTISVGKKTEEHNFVTKTTVAATNESLGYIIKECSVCGQLAIEILPSLGSHVFDREIDRKDATCTAEGYVTYECSAHTDCGMTSTVVLPATGHNEKLTYTAASCEVAGKSEMICDTCKVVLETKEIPATGHAWGAGEVTKQPTCTAKGEMKYTCSVCSATKTEEIATNPNAHVYTAGAVTPATCVTPELTTYSCACGKSEIKQTAPANGHSWNAEKTVDKEATCIDAGSKSTHCANCEATKDAEVIPPTGHSLKTQKVDPTCTKGGYTAEVCEKCGYLNSVTAVDPLGHDYEVTTTTAATCTEGATETKTCKRVGCAETVTTITSNPTGHNWGEWFISKPATATEKGEKTRKCQRIGCTEAETCEIPTIGHNWNAGSVTKTATCYEVGTMLYTCTGCENCVAAGTMATLEVEIPKTEHTYTQETNPATCEADGTTVVKCSVAECGYEAQTVTLPATGHTLERDTASDKAPTCTKEGSFAYKCKNCEYTETITRDALGHDYSTTAVTVTEPTCTTDGVKAYKCTRCDAKIETAIPKTGHDFSITEVIAPTCTDKGYTIVKCANKDCTENYVVSDSFVDAAGHNWGAWTTVTEPTNDTDGLKKRVCGTDPNHVEYAPIPMLGHEWNDGEVTIPADCTTDGLMTYSCIKANCANCTPDNPATRTEVIPATGHNMKAVQTAATCTTPPYQTWTCDNGCGHSYIVVTGAATGHNYTKTTTAATCEADGNEHYVCANCGHEYDVVLPKLGHNYKTEVTAPTCKNYGYTTYTCQNDPTHTYKSDFVATIAHTYAKDNAQSVAATCVSKGYDVMVCTNVIDSEGHTCGDSYKVIIDATGHAYNTGVVTTPAACTANGVKTFTCANCGDTYTEVIPATGHAYGEGVVEREADDGNYGLISYTCSKCNDKFYEEYVINSTEHTWNVEVKQNPTCTEKGVSVYTCINPSCEVCSHGVIAKFTKQTSALGHNYVGVETTAPTCTEKGVMTYTCSRCSDSYTEDIPATGHTYGAGAVTEATCTTAGYTKYTCETCGYEMLDNYVAPLGHQMDSHVVTAPTCTTAGWTTHSCTRTDCGYSYIDSVTEATGHDYDSAVTTEPTCEADGVKTYTCKNCAADVDGHSYTETVAKTGHAWGEWVITKYPTATAEGEKTRTCANVNCPIQTETVTLPKLGHTMVAGDIKVQPTCTTTGVQEYVCTEHTGDAACGYTYEVTLPALGHDWNDGEITIAATCTADGQKTYTCKRTDCGAVKTEVVPKTGHDMETAVTEATCVSDKFTTYTCKTCGYAYVINETGTALGHTFSVVVETVDATCEAKGYTIYKCERCEQTKTETTQAIGHDWGEWKTTTPATCEERGVETRVCKNNPNHIQTRRTNTVDHDFVSTLYHPTCTESGFTILACKGCGKTIRTDFVPAYGHKYDEGVYEDATCTTPGGIRYTCTNTNPDGTPCGHSYLVKDTEPLGHTWGKWHYVEHPTVEDAYAKQRDCTRGTCTAIEYERGKMSNEDDINVYYKVEFYNPWTTDTCYELNNGRTKLAKTYKTTKVNEGYYLAGTEATYPSSVLPKRDKDYTWGAYKLIDWTYDEVGQTDSALNDMKSITKNMAVYANFEGYDVYYKVRFWSGSDPLTIEQIILHGHSAQYPFDNPTKADNLHYKYEFTGWDYDYTAIYDSVGINALYNEIPKTYTMVYCDWNGDELAREDFQYGDPAKKNPTNLERPENATYIYQFSGKWQTQPGKEQFIELSSLTVPLGTKEGDAVKVYAKYYQKAKSYVVNIYGYGINKELIPGATVQIYNSNGQIVTTTKLDEESKAIITLNYDTSYQIVITDDVGNVGKGDIELNTTMKDENGKLVPTMTTIYLKQYEDPDHGGSNCHCICHSFLGGFWISILNMIYRLFGRKIVCCYDMFATHGDRLIYGK